MTYTYDCPRCHCQVSMTEVRVAARDNQLCVVPGCSGKLVRNFGQDAKTQAVTVPRNFHTSASEIFPNGVPKKLMPAPEARGGRLDNSANTGNLKYVPGMDFKK